MDGKCKRQAGVDNLISYLPRNLIHSILEHMPVQEAARTSILSRQWRYIWATQAQLVLDKEFTIEAFKSRPCIEFSKTIYRILLFHGGPILKFVLYIPDYDFDHGADIDQWVLFLSRNGVKELNIYNADCNPCTLSSYTFTCPELTHLQLCNCVIKRPHPSRCSRNLVILHFERITFESNILETLLSSTPLLETLSFIRCTGIDHFKIHGLKLKTLKIYVARKLKSVSFFNTPDLNSVCITPYHEVRNPNQAKITSLTDFFVNLPGIGKLILDGYFLKFLSAGVIPKRLPTILGHLKILRLLNLDLSYSNQIQCALCLLRSSSANLEELVIKVFDMNNIMMDSELNFGDEVDYTDLKLEKLHTVEFVFIKALRAELVFIEFLLACCPSLERMLLRLNTHFDANEGFRISKELMGFPRVSPKAKIILLEPPV